MKYIIEYNEAFGRGLFASRDLVKGEILFISELLVLNEKDTLTLNNTDLKYYVFNYDEKRDCLVLGDAELINHSKTPNLDFKLVNIGQRKVMQFVVIEDVMQGEQLFIDYKSDDKVDVKLYTVNMMDTQPTRARVLKGK